jgi:hypothetical protein
MSFPPFAAMPDFRAHHPSSPCNRGAADEEMKKLMGFAA